MSTFAQSARGDIHLTDGSPARSPVQLYVGFGLIFAVMVGSFALLRTNLANQTFQPDAAAPALSILAMMIVGGAFIVAFGVPSPKALTICVVAAFIVGGAVAFGERAYLHQYDSLFETADRLTTREDGLTAADRATLTHAVEIMIAVMLLVPPIEELAKQSILFALCGTKQVTSMRVAMCCGGLIGVIYGIIESNCYAFDDFHHEKITAADWLIRYFAMSATHGMWDALAAGLLFAFVSRREKAMMPPIVHPMVAAYLIVTILHLLHNVLQEFIGAQVQVISMLGVILPLYIFAKRSWRSA